MASRTYDFSIYYQRTLIHRVLTDAKYCIQAKSLLKPEVFDSDPLKWMCRKILLGCGTLRILISEFKKERDNLDPDLASAIIADLKTFITPFNSDESEYAIENLKEFVESQDINECLNKAALAASEGAKAEKIRELLSPAIYSQRFIKNITLDPIATYKERFEQRQKMNDEGDIVYTSCGFRNIDEDIMGPMLGQFWVFFGDTNLGKSQAAVSAAKLNILKGIKALHFSLEDKLEITLQRYDASFTMVDHDKLSFSKYSEREYETISSVYELLNKKRKDYLRVSKVEEGSTVQDLYAEYKRLQIRDGFYPQVIIIDSPHDMEAVKQKENFRLSQRQLFKELRDFCQSENVAIICYDQSKQEVKGKVADTSAASESYDKARIVDGFITMNQTKLQRKDGIIQLFTAKMKDRTKHKSYFVRPNFKISRFVAIEGGDY